MSTSTQSASAASFTADIPSKIGNPFIDQTTLPEGTLFIIFGAILGGIILVILVWRGYAVYSIRAAAKNSEAKFTALEPSYGGPFVDPVVDANAEAGNIDSNNPERQLSKRSRQRKKQNDKEQRRKEAAKFFSPTVEVMTHGNPTNAPMVTSSNYLPSGYYSGAPISQGSRPVSMATSMNLLAYQGPNSRPQSMALSMSGITDVPGTRTSIRTVAPPDGPLEGPPAGPMSGTGAGPTQQPQTRKLRPPSQYLDDLIGN